MTNPVSISQWLSAALTVSGTFFFIVGTLGLLRFPDIYSRLHALTKADNLGLGLLIAGLALQTDTLSSALKLILIWLLVMVTSATTSFLIARTTLEQGIQPKDKP
ncbi:monovalent cation/H(+) antiporter subunit G [Nitrosococcus watsonii]|uniref:Monovalent cation/proton antiporter, MnhG/PhaG subunit n=1 Tax=Nitrosococcus watsoni (strain C-113) TaxID=105559 RepID=D8K5D1_NITWC|nr:monovalent cation/H(+) antiporter subunit G [Nitrosococcus watsonii]ADJ28108.1 monovalent cation/proton antiporter, MnhG/PhaG subunit [Nitrosococcus watsonii C-113]